MLIGLWVAVSVLVMVCVFLGLLVMGCLKEERGNNEGRIRDISGREIEMIRYKLTNIGKVSVTKTEMLNIIRTMRSIQLGVYKDVDPYVPDDPYEGLYAEDIDPEDIQPQTP